MTMNLARRSRRTHMKTLYWARYCLGARMTRFSLIAAAVVIAGALGIAAVASAHDRLQPPTAQKYKPAPIAKVAADINGTAFKADLVREPNGFEFTLNLGKGGT